MRWVLEQNSRDSCVEQRRDETNKECAKTQACEIVPAFGRNGSDAAELNADRGKISEPGKGEGGKSIRPIGHKIGRRFPALHDQVGVVLVDGELGSQETCHV